MKKKHFLATTLLSACMLALPVHASLIGVSGGTSSVGGTASIIAAPAFATDAQITNQAQQGFNEAQDVLTSIAFSTDTGSIAASTMVDSHMIFLNTALGGINHLDITWTFDGTILGVMSDSGGLLEGASTAELGSLVTTYGGPFNARGMEGSDSYTFSGNTITVDMSVTQPGDWIRVVTATPVPTTGTLLLISLGLIGLFASRSRFSKLA